MEKIKELALGAVCFTAKTVTAVTAVATTGYGIVLVDRLGCLVWKKISERA